MLKLTAEFAEPLGVLVGLLATLGLSSFTGRVMDRVKLKDHLAPPVAESELELWNRWLKVIANQHVEQSGRILGWLESALFFLGVWTKTEVIVGGWLAFKLAAKWETWNNIVAPNVPDVPFKDDPMRNVWARHRWGIWLFRRFLLGTLFNLFCAVGGYLIGRSTQWLVGP